MTKTELVSRLSKKLPNLRFEDVKSAVEHILDQMSETLGIGDRIEIRGFGVFSLHYRPPRMGRNAKNGEMIALLGRSSPHFKVGKALHERVSKKRKQSRRSRAFELHGLGA